MSAAVLALRERARTAGKIDLARACTIVLEPDRHAPETVRLAAVDVEAALRDAEPEPDDEPTLPRTLTPQTARVVLPTMDELDQEWRAERAAKEDRRG